MHKNICCEAVASAVVSRVRDDADPTGSACAQSVTRFTSPLMQKFVNLPQVVCNVELPVLARECVEWLTVLPHLNPFLLHRVLFVLLGQPQKTWKLKSRYKETITTKSETDRVRGGGGWLVSIQL